MISVFERLVAGWETCPMPKCNWKQKLQVCKAPINRLLIPVNGYLQGVLACEEKRLIV